MESRKKFRGAVVLILALVSFCAAGQAGKDPLMDPWDLTWNDTAPDIFKIKLVTSKGDVILEVHKAWAPIGVNRFYNLVRNGYYNDSRFYRIRAGEFVQFGIAGKPAVSKIWEHVTIPDDAVEESNARGTFAFAMTGPNTRTTQIYINLKNNSHQDSQGFAPLGLVSEGMSILDQLYSGYAETSGGGMRAGKQARLFEEGNAYLDREFPKLDKIIRAEIVK